MTSQQQNGHGKMLALPSTSKVEGADGIVLDALPYIDDANYTEEHRELALKMIEAEMRKMPRTKNYLKDFPEPEYDKFLTPQLIELLHQIENKQEIPKLDLLRYEVPAPGRAASKTAWKAAIDNCKAQLGNQALRKMNLELLEEFGPDAYLRSNDRLKSEVEKEEADLYKVRSKLFELNSRRKRSQMEAGEKLTTLGQAWVQLVTKNAAMVLANDALEVDIMRMAKKLKVEPGLEQKDK